MPELDFDFGCLPPNRLILVDVHLMWILGFAVSLLVVPPYVLEILIQVSSIDKLQDDALEFVSAV